MSHEKANQDSPSFNLGERMWLTPFNRKQAALLSKSDLDKYMEVHEPLIKAEGERQERLEIQKKQVLARRERALEISMFSDEILKITERINFADSNEIGIMLLKQASVTQELFRVFLGRMDMEQSFSGRTTYARLALQAQSLSRKTLATLIELQSPRRSATFIKQQNNAQINVNSDKQTSEK